MFFDGLDGDGSALGLADHADEPGLGEHLLGEFVHAGGGGGTGGADDFVPHRVHRTHVVDEAIGEVDPFGERLSPRQHVDEALVGGVASGQQLAGEQDAVAGLPGSDLFRRDLVEIDAPCVRTGLPGDVRPILRTRGLEPGRSGAVQGEIQVSGRGAVGDDGNRQGGSMGGVGPDLHVQDGGQPPQPLGAYPQGIDLFEQLQAQLFDGVRGTPGLELMDVDVFHQGLLGQQHGLFRGAADADPQHPRRTPAGAHGGNGLQYPVHQAVAGIQDGELALVFRAAALGRQPDFHAVPRHQLGMDHRRGVVLGVLTLPDGW